MTYLHDIFEAVLECCNGQSKDDAKRISELAIAQHYVERLYLGKLSHPDKMEKLKSAIFTFIHSPEYLSQLSNPFLLQPYLTPYIFLRGQGWMSDHFENLLPMFLQNDFTVKQCYPYRRLERQHLLYRLGEDTLGAALLPEARADALQAYTYNRDLSYAFTHAVFYLTDFGLLERSDHLIKDVASLIMVMSYERNDVDLFYEACLCLLSQPVSQDDISDMLFMISDFAGTNEHLGQHGDMHKDYHPLLVYDILRGLCLRNHNIDIATAEVVENAEGPILSLREILKALPGKQVAEIVDSYSLYKQKWGPRPFIEEMISHRLDFLSGLAEQQVLFEYEFSKLGQYNPAIYKEFAALVKSARLSV